MLTPDLESTATTSPARHRRTVRRTLAALLAVSALTGVALATSASAEPTSDATPTSATSAATPLANNVHGRHANTHNSDSANDCDDDPGNDSSGDETTEDATDADMFGVPQERWDALVESGDITVGHDEDGEYLELSDTAWEQLDPYLAGLDDTDDGAWDDTDGGEWDDGESDDSDYYGDHVTPLASLPVSGDALDTTGVDAHTTEQAQQLWDRFTTLIPANRRTMINKFEIIPEGDTGGYVVPDSNDPTKWTLGIAIGLGSELDSTLIHEFAHLLTLNANEVPPSTKIGSCATYFTGEGCALESSTIAKFVAKFWPEATQTTLDTDGPEAVYDANPDHFVTDYASSNPAEDLAETFAVFVLQPRPSGDTVADQKVRMLWDAADMVELRDQIRSGM